MRNGLKFVICMALAMALMLAVRTLAFSVHSITGNGLAPLYQDGDQILVNRCSYGLRIEGNRLLPYSRLWRQDVHRGDIVAFTVPGDTATLPFGFRTGILLARCKAVPGGLKTCADHNYYWLESINQQNPIDSRHLGFISEKQIIGSVVTVLYNRHNIRLVP